MNEDNWSGYEENNSDNPIRYRYGNYLNWKDNFTGYELIEGVVYHTGFAFGCRYRKIFIELIRQAANFFAYKKLDLYCRPFDLRLPEGAEDDSEIMTVVQPDIIVIDDNMILDERGCSGVPLLIIEFITSRAQWDNIKIRRSLYEKHGVSEYWLVDCAGKNVELYYLNNNKYDKADVFLQNEIISSAVIDDFKIDLSTVFGKTPPYYS